MLALTKIWQCPCLISVTSTFPLSNNVYIAVLPNSRSKIQISKTVYVFCEDHVFPKVVLKSKEPECPLMSLISSQEIFSR